MNEPEGLQRLPSHRSPRKRKPKDMQEELSELNEELLVNRPPLDFASYQREVAVVTTPEWPISNPDLVFRQIIWHCGNAIGGDHQAVVIQAAAILRHLSELCDYAPVSLERIAHISLSEIPQMDNELGATMEESEKVRKL